MRWNAALRLGNTSDIKPDDLDADALSAKAFDEAFRLKRQARRNARAQVAQGYLAYEVRDVDPRTQPNGWSIDL